MPIQVCFKGVNTLKSMLMHPKDKISNDQKKDLVYHWECKADGCNSSYIGETSRALDERVKEHSKSTTLAILKHCKDLHHPLPSILDFNIIDKDPSQITREAKEAIHIRRLDPSLNRNIGEMSIPHCFDHLLGAKPKHPRVGALVTPQSVEENAPPSQIPGLNLTQFKQKLGVLDQTWLNTYLDLPLGPAGLETCSIDHQLSCHIKSIQAKLFSTWHELSNVIPSSPQECDKHIHMCWSLIATALHTIRHWSKITEPPEKVVKITFTVQTLWSKTGVKFLPLHISPSSGLFFISPDEDLLFEVETSWVKLLCKFQCWWSELNWCYKCY